MILSWHENLTKDEVPPEYLWEDPQGLEQWWATVEERREQRFSGNGSPSDGRDDEPPEMAQNDIARALKQG